MIGLPEPLTCVFPISPEVACKCKGEPCSVWTGFGSLVTCLPSAPEAFVAEVKLRVKCRFFLSTGGAPWLCWESHLGSCWLCVTLNLSCLPVARGLGLLVHLRHTPVGVTLGVLSDPWGLGAALGSQHLAFPLPALLSLLWRGHRAGWC